MIQSATRSRQRPRVAWSRDKLLRERAIALGQAIDTSTLKSYSSALNSYLSFIRMHDLSLNPHLTLCRSTQYTCVITLFPIRYPHICPVSVNN